MYSLLKFVHVASVILWVGGAAAVAGLSLRLLRSLHGEAVQALARAQAFYGLAVLMPSAIVALLTGFGLMGMMGAGMPLWMVWGLVGVAGSIAIGATVLRKTSEALIAAASGEDAQRVPALTRRLALWSGVNIALLLSTVWAMVAKP